MPHGEGSTQHPPMEYVLRQIHSYDRSDCITNSKTRRAGWCAACVVRWTACGCFSTKTVPLPPITMLNGLYALPCCGVNAASAPKMRKAIVSWNASSTSGKPAVLANGHSLSLPTPCTHYCLEISQKSHGLTFNLQIPRKRLQYS